jgi:hypothetical protein
MHGMVAWDRRTTIIWGNGGVPLHATITRQKLHEIGGVTIPR